MQRRIPRHSITGFKRGCKTGVSVAKRARRVSAENKARQAQPAQPENRGLRVGKAPLAQRARKGRMESRGNGARLARLVQLGRRETKVSGV